VNLEEPMCPTATRSEMPPAELDFEGRYAALGPFPLRVLVAKERQRADSTGRLQDSITSSGCSSRTPGCVTRSRSPSAVLLLSGMVGRVIEAQIVRAIPPSRPADDLAHASRSTRWRRWWRCGCGCAAGTRGGVRRSAPHSRRGEGAFEHLHLVHDQPVQGPLGVQASAARGAGVKNQVSPRCPDGSK